MPLWCFRTNQQIEEFSIQIINLAVVCMSVDAPPQVQIPPLLNRTVNGSVCQRGAVVTKTDDPKIQLLDIRLV